LTLVKSFNCTNSLNFNAGSGTLEIDDPYDLFSIKQEDIEQAISDTARQDKKGGAFLTAANNALKETISQDINALNQARAVRGANPIVFVVSPKTLLGKRLRAIIDGIGEEIQFEYGANGNTSVLGTLVNEIIGSSNNITVDTNYVIGSSDFDTLNLGIQRLATKSINSTLSKPAPGSIEGSVNSFVNSFSNVLNSSELDIFKRLLSNYYLALQQEELTRINKIETNKDNNELRQKLLDFYCGRPLIQPMDTVHVYIRSNMQTDSKLSLALKNDFGPTQILDQMGKIVSDFKSSFTSSGDLSDNLEKTLFFGKDFPEYIWKNIRNQLIGDKIGTHVFAGVVTDGRRSKSPGNSSLSITMSNNSEFFKMGMVNINPSLDDSYNSLYDPLTPFKFNFNSVNGSIDTLPVLLDENNPKLLSAFSKFTSGRNAGRSPGADNIAQDIELSYSNQLRNIFHAPPGFVYEWKKGIGTYTGFQTSTKYKSSIERPKAPQLTSDPFAGQDIMNCLSLYITGQPYNFVTFYNAVRNYDSYSKDDAKNEDSSTSFTRQLQFNLTEKNNQYGKFIPFKKLTVDEDTAVMYVSRQFSIIDTNNKINDLLKQRARIVNFKLGIEAAYSSSSGAPSNSIDKVGLVGYNEKIADLDSQIWSIQNKSDIYNNSDGIIKIAGDDISFDTDEFLNKYDNSIITNKKSRKLLRRKINFLSRRLPWQVKANEDRNFFIVDDAYDKDYDLQAYESVIDSSKLSTFNSQFSAINDKIVQTASILQLECFIDSQGHIQVRPPQYNKVPSSLFMKMFKLNKEEGIRLFPKFLEDLYSNQIDLTAKQIQVCEDNIRLFCAILNFTNDIDAAVYLSSGDTALDYFAFISNEDTGDIFSKGSIKELLVYSSPEMQDQNSEELKSTSFIANGQTGVKNIFTFVKRMKIETNEFGEGAYKFTSNISNVKDKISVLLERIYNNSGQKVDINKYLVESKKLGNSVLSSVDLLNINNQISYYVGQRQKLLKSFNGLLKTVTESYSSASQDNVVNILTGPTSFDESNIPDIFENLVEDENYDDFGPGSGKRFIIKNSQIKNYSLVEKAPQNTVIEVNGRISPQLAENAIPAGTSITLPGGTGGNMVTSAIAVDYDLWRMYGFRSTESVSPVFFTNPVTQCAPYAVALLNKQRAEILSARVSLVGDEFKQPGEVYFLEEENLLFYSHSVSHQFNYGENFSTDMELTYGHTPGKYIPNPLDVIGKVLYNNRNSDSNIVIKNDSAGPETPLGTLVNSITYTTSIDPKSSNTVNNKYEINNSRVIQSIRSAAINMMSSSNINSMPIIELRLFSNNLAPNSDLEELAKYFIGLLTGTNVLAAMNENIILIPKENVRINTISKLDPTKYGSPSKTAFSIAKDILSEKGITFSDASGYAASLDDIIIKNIIDVWLIYT